MKVTKAFGLLAMVAAAAMVPGSALAVFGSPTVDGTGIAIPASRLVSLQTEPDGFGGATRAAGLYLANDATNLYISIPGNLTGGNAYHIFLDTKPGGATDVATNVNYNEYDDLAVAGGGNMPTGFLVDYYINFKPSTDTGLIDVQAGTGSYKGNAGNPAPGYAFAYNGTNAETNPANYSTVSTGAELQIPLADLGLTPGTTFKIFVVGGNENKGFNPATYMSNQILPPQPGASNYGNDGGGGAGGDGLSFNGTGGPNVVPLTYTVEAPATPYSATGYGRSTIGTGGNYLTLREATDAISTVGTRDASTWVFEFISNTTEPTNAFLSASVNPAGRILFRPGYSLNPTITFTNNLDNNLGASGNFVIGSTPTGDWPPASLGVRNIEVDGNNGIADRQLTFTNSGITVNFQSLITVVGDADFVTVRNTRLINTSTGTTSTAGISFRPRLSGSNNLTPNDFVVENNEIVVTASSQGHGINITNSGTLTAGNAAHNFTIHNNDISARIRGVFLNFAGSGTISDNRIAVGLGGSTNAISTFGIYNLTANSFAGTTQNHVRNVISVETNSVGTPNGAHGLFLSTYPVGSTINVENNTIRIVNTGAATSPLYLRGIVASSNGTYNIRHNTIDISSVNAPTAVTSPAAVFGIGQFLASAAINVQNNIISNRVPNGAAYWRPNNPTGTFNLNDNLISNTVGPVASNLRLITSAGTPSRSSAGTVRTISMGTTNHGLSVGQTVTVFLNSTIANTRLYEGTFTVESVPSATSFTYDAGTALTEATATGVAVTVYAPATSPIVATTLAEWQATTSSPDTTSTAADVSGSLSPLDLHLVNTAASGLVAAAQVGGITIDIDGQTRAATPYRGADEFTVNTPPVGVLGTPIAAVDENTASAVLVASAIGNDNDINDFPVITASVNAGTVSVTRTSIKAYRVDLTSALDYETNPVLQLTLTATDRAGQTAQQVINIPVNDVNEAPTAISPTTASVDENVPLGTVVATLTTTDPDIGQSHTYALVAGPGDTDNALFAISGSNLVTAAALDYEAITNPLSVRVQTTDNGAPPLSFTGNIAITVNDLPDNPAAIAVTTGTLDFGTVQIGNTADLTTTISNTGDLPLTISALTITGADAAGYSIIGGPVLPATVNNGSPLTLTVRFAPTLFQTYNNAALEITHNAPGSPTSVTLLGTGQGLSVGDWTEMVD
jgi:hypothetical protein